HSIVNTQRQRLVETQPCSKQGVVAVDVGWAPVVGKRGVQALTSPRVHAPKGLAGHPIQQIVSRTLLASRVNKCSGVVRSAELIEPGVAFPVLDALESSDRRSFLPGSESDFGNAYRPTAKLWNETGWIMSKGIAVLGHDHGFHIDVVSGNYSQFCRGC